MPARKTPVVRLVAVLIAIVVAIVVVLRWQSGSAVSGALSPSAIGAEAPPESSESRVLVNMNALVLELDMAAKTGQGLLDAIGAGEEREGIVSADQFAAAGDLLETANVLSNHRVINWAGNTATATVSAAAFKTAAAATSVRDISVDLVAGVNDDGTLTLDASFRIMQANGQFEIMAEEWGLPFGTRRSASATLDLAPGERVFLRRHLGSVEILVLVSAEVMEPKGGGRGERGGDESRDGGGG